jgi:hypothetical protein
VLCRECLCEQETGAHVDVQVPVDLISGDLFKASQSSVGVIYDQNVYVSEGCRGRPDKRFRRIGGFQVGVHMFDSSAALPQLVDKRNTSPRISSPRLRSIIGREGMEEQVRPEVR